MNTNSDFLKTLDERITEHNEELGWLLSERQKLEIRISQVQHWMERAKALREEEAKAVGAVESVQPPIVATHRFFGMRTREACHAVLRERKRMSKDELANELKRGGFDFGESSPLRVVHFALVNDPKVKMEPYGDVEWIEEVT